MTVALTLGSKLASFTIYIVYTFMSLRMHH